jgi:hypothetical protein
MKPPLVRHTHIVVLAVMVAVAVGGCAGNGRSGASSVPTAPPSLILRPDGIGPYRIGDPADVVIDGLSSDIGGWDVDSLDEDSTVQVPVCDPSGTRMVAWGNLVLLFSGPPTAETLTTWTYGFDPVTGNAIDVRGLDLRTDDGIGLGTPRTDVERILTGRLVIEDDLAIDVSTFAIDPDDARHLVGRFASADPDAGVQTLSSAPGCDDGP